MRNLLKGLAAAVGVVVVLAATGLFATALGISDLCETVVHETVLSKSGQQAAFVFGRDCGAVATITSTTVDIGPPDVTDPMDDDRPRTVFQARVEEGSPLRVNGYGPGVAAVWHGDTVLSVRYDPRAEVRFAVTRIHGLTVVYDTLP